MNQLNEVEMRCERAVENLIERAHQLSMTHASERTRLLGKAEGVKLALSYIEEARR